MSVDEEQEEESSGVANFTDAVKTKDYPEVKKQVQDTEESLMVENVTDEAQGIPTTQRDADVQKLFNELGNEKSREVQTYGLAKEIILDNKKYVRNKITIARRERLVELDELLAKARFTPKFTKVEWHVLKERAKVIWGIEVTDDTDTEKLYKIMDATMIVINNRFR